MSVETIEMDALYQALESMLEQLDEKQLAFFERLFGTRKSLGVATDKVRTAIGLCERTIKANL